MSIHTVREHIVYRNSGVVFIWHGGAYIDIGHIEDNEHKAYDVINVWDYKKGERIIPFTEEAMQARCDEWLNDNMF